MKTVRIKDNFEYREWILASGIVIVMELYPYGSLLEVLKEIMSRKRTICEEKRFVWYIHVDVCPSSCQGCERGDFQGPLYEGKSVGVQ